MNFRITVLCENSVGPISGTLGEHGFAVLIAPVKGAPLLFDTGQGLTLLHNARRMNKDLAQVRQVIISHGHYDHCGGLLPLLRETGPKEVWAHPGIFTPRYRLKDNGEHIPIGIPYGRAEFEAMGADFNLGATPRKIAPGIHLTGEVPRRNGFEKGDAGIYCDTTGCSPDLVQDDQSLVLETDKGLVVILGCCHAGLVNTLEHIAQMTGRQDVFAVIGGTHLAFCSQEQIEKTVAAIRTMEIKRMAAGHCTGFSASARLSRELPGEFQVAQVGYTLEM